MSAPKLSPENRAMYLNSLIRCPLTDQMLDIIDAQSKLLDSVSELVAGAIGSPGYRAVSAIEEMFELLHDSEDQ
jgi:hypothetical protein